MNKIILEQLQKVKVADLSHFDSATNTYLIPKVNLIKVNINSCYLIKLKSEFFQNQTLRTNWNNNIMPRENYLKAEVQGIMNNMIKVMAVEYNATTEQNTGYWNGWLPITEIEVLQQI